MKDYKTYFLMQAPDVPDYVKNKVPDFFPAGADLASEEIGDGNLNYVFRVKDKVSGKTIIVKQAGAATRISKDMIISTDRGRIEAKILQIQAEMAPGLVPKVYLYDGVMLPLPEVERLAKKACANVRTMGMALTPCVIPENGKANFTIAEGEMEIGMSPRIYGNYWYDKPIFFYWELIGAFKVFGINEFAARFFPAVFGIIGLFMTLAVLVVKHCGRELISGEAEESTPQLD